MIDVEKNKEEFISIFKTNIKRNGFEKVLEWLEKADFFTAPASAYYHLAEEGGLCQHSLNVYHRLLKLVKQEYGENYNEKISDETLAITALLHDVCKVNCYKKDTKNVKNEDGEWVKEPYYKKEEKLHYGHGTKSVFILQQFGTVYLDEALAIRYHMGGLEYVGTNFVEPDVAAVYNDNPLATLLHIADMEATYLDERTRKSN